MSVGGDPQGDDETVIAEMHDVDQQRDEIEAIKGALCQAATCAAVRATKRRLTALWPLHLGPPAPKLRVYWRVATPTSICSPTRRSSGSVVAMV